MEPVASNIQVLLQAAEFLERREREAEHGYASLCPHRSPGPVNKRRKRSPQASGTLDSGRSVHNELEKRRRAQLKRCLEELKQQMPLGADCARYTTLSLLRWARMHIQKLEEQEQQARRLKEKLRSKQQSLQQQLEQLRGLAGPGERERPRADSLDSSGLSSEHQEFLREKLSTANSRPLEKRSQYKTPGESPRAGKVTPSPLSFMQGSQFPNSPVLLTLLLIVWGLLS
ncbi:max dimerization protein 3 isoform X1 [Prionailurus viverrinus]|uniref:max dimerization protein 3 isoform X1 n=1 Tax=Prionailurus viverrinus TaxID=61388 RepID=UPI001FF66E5C|nr:max dimerization protein 3 isoform X1 [Prionailurus viverrinus]